MKYDCALWEKPFSYTQLKKWKALEGTLIWRSVWRTVVLEREFANDDNNPFDQGLKFIRLTIVLAVLLVFLDLGFSFWTSCCCFCCCSISSLTFCVWIEASIEQKHLKFLGKSDYCCYYVKNAMKKTRRLKRIEPERRRRMWGEVGNWSEMLIWRYGSKMHVCVLSEILAVVESGWIDESIERRWREEDSAARRELRRRDGREVWKENRLLFKKLQKDIVFEKYFVPKYNL